MNRTKKNQKSGRPESDCPAERKKELDFEKKRTTFFTSSDFDGRRKNQIRDKNKNAKIYKPTTWQKLIESPWKNLYSEMILLCPAALLVETARENEFRAQKKRKGVLNNF